MASDSLSYWCDKRITARLTGPTGTVTFALDRPFARVGSHADCDIILPSPRVGRRLAYLHATDAGLYALFLETQGIDAEGTGRWLDPADALDFGDYRLTAQVEGIDTTDDAPSSDLLAWGVPPPWPLLTIWHRDKLLERRRLHSVLNPVGRRPACALQLKAERVSAFHCAFVWQQEQLWCVDLLSSNGTRRDGKRITCELLEPGTRLEIGDFSVLFQRVSSGSVKPRDPSECRAITLPRSASSPGAEALAAGQSDVPQAEVPEAVPSGVGLQTIPAASLEELLAEPPPPGIDQAALAQERQEVAALREQLARQQAQLDEERTAFAAQREQVEQEQQSLAAEREQLSREQQTLAAAQASFEQERQRYQTERDEALRQQQSEQAKLAADQAKALQRLELDRAQLEKEKAELLKEREAIETAQRAWQSEREATAAELAPRSAGAKRLETELSAAKAELTSNSADLKRLEAELRAAKQELEEQRAQPGMFAAAAIAPTQPDLWAEQHELQRELEERAQRLEAEQSLLASQAAQISKESAELEQSRRMWQAEQQAKLQEVESNRAELTALQAALVAAQSELEEQKQAWREQQEAGQLQAREQAAQLTRERAELEASQTLWRGEQEQAKEQLDAHAAELSQREHELREAEQTSQQFPLQEAAASETTFSEAATQEVPVSDLPAQESAADVPSPQQLEDMFLEAMEEPIAASSPRADEIETDEPVLDDALEVDSQIISLDDPEESQITPEEEASAVAAVHESDLAPVETPDSSPPELQLTFKPRKSSGTSRAQPDQVSEFLGDRLAERDRKERSKLWILWVACGFGVVLIIAVAAIAYQFIQNR